MEIPRSNGGYWPGMSQPVQSLAFELADQPGVKLPRLDALLQEVFGVEIPDCCTAAGVKPLRDVQFAWRVLQVMRELLLAVNLPAFDPGIVVGVDKAPGKRATKKFQVLIPHQPYYPEAMVRAALAQACKIMLHLAGSKFQRAGFSQLLEDVHRAFVVPYLKNFQGGESTVPILHAAWYLGIPFRHLSHGVYRLGWGCRAQLVDRSAVGSDFAIGARLSQNKLMAARMLRDAGLPASEHLSVSSFEGACAAANTLGWPVVVKPLNRDRGEGVTVDVVDVPSLKDAYGRAAALSPLVLIERQVKGVCHRIFVAKGRDILFVSRRLPKSVTGDGKLSVRELIAQANRQQLAVAPWLRLKPFPDDAEAQEQLAAVGLTLDAVPAEGQLAPLRRIQSVADGGVVENWVDRIHPDNVDIALRAAALFNLDSAGIDLISDDISKPWRENGAIINEVNFASLLGAKGRVGAVPRPALIRFLELIFRGNGRIPVELFSGGEQALRAARERQAELVGDGHRCYLTSHCQTWRPDGQVQPGTADSLFGRTQQLLANGDVEMLILVVQTDEWLYSGLPLDGPCRVVWVDDQLADWHHRAATVPEPRCREIAQLLAWLARSGDCA